MIASEQTFDVGGVRLERPFKIRRLGHVGFNCIRMDEALAFYRDDVGFHISDRLDFGAHAERPEDIAGMGDSGAYFMRYGTDHHSFVLFNKRVREAVDKQRRFSPGVTINQISWQVGSLGEVSRGREWLVESGMEIQRTGRDMPGSNWHTYFYDPDGHTNEIYYGMEQIGWEGRSKPLEMHDRGFRAKPDLPQLSEEAEVEEALDRGIDLHSAVVWRDALPRTYDVDGVLLPRPFKVGRIGPVSLFVKDVAAAVAFYERIMGFTITEEVRYDGERCVFLRANTEHHAVALYPVALRERLGLRADSTVMAVGVQVGSYRQLCDARSFFAARGAAFVDVPPALHPGIDYAFHVTDPDGHALQVYFAMEQIGWDGTPRPAHLRPQVRDDAWPATLDATADAYAGETLLGPLG